MRQPTLKTLALSAAGLLLVGCTSQGRGTSEPPKAFGSVSKPFFGCPDIQGTYAWPPTQGHYTKAEAPPRIRQPQDAGFPVAIHSSAAQIWISQRAGGFIFRNRPVYSGELPSNPALMQWGFSEVSRADYACTSGGIEVDLGEVPEAIKKKEQYGGKGATYGYRIIRMSDGAIAVGLKTEVYGRSQSLFTWGDVSRGSIPQPNATYWDWMRLARTGSGDSEPLPVRMSAPQP